MTETDYQATLRTIQSEQDAVMKELRTVDKQQQELFRLNQEEQRLYSDVSASCTPEERPFFQDRGTDSLQQHRKAQQWLEEKEATLKQEKKDLVNAEEEVIREQRSNLMKQKEMED